MIRGYSFHSVKGGVGKSTLSTHCALELAGRLPDRPVYLIDLDLTGTSLADGLPLEAPAFAEEDVWATEPVGFVTEAESRNRAQRREAAFARDREAQPCGVPYLNDWLLHAGQAGEGALELPLSAVCWRLRGGPENLRVLPSSALPGDLQRTIPVVFDEEFSAFLEARLEWLLAAMAKRHEGQDVGVVVDVPPTIPGLSRAVLGLSLRLSAKPPIPLALDGFIPADLTEGLWWRAALVTTLDRPDIRAMNRWLGRLRTAERSTIRVVINRLQDGEGRHSLANIFREGPKDEQPLEAQPEDLAPMDLMVEQESLFDPELQRALWVPDDRGLRLFQSDDLPRWSERIGRLLDELA